MAHNTRFMCRCQQRALFSICNLNRSDKHLKSSSFFTRFISTGKHLNVPQLKTGYGKGPLARVSATLDENTEDFMKENNLRAKDHPGVFHLPKVSLPPKFTQAVEKIIARKRTRQLTSWEFYDENIKRIAENAAYLRNYLWSRRLPMDNERFKQKVEKIEGQIRTEEEVLLPFLSEEQTVKLEKARDAKILRQLRYSVYHWEPIQFTRHKALEYILARSAGEYAALCRIFNEISKRDTQFQPKTLCDFGSGVGTVTWAAREYWQSSLVEHLCADASPVMNDLAELILRGGCKNNDHPIPALFLRQHLPESFKIRYDLVVSAFSLMELPSAKDRIATIDKLWNKTDEYLVIVESGTRAGFRAVIEARDYVLGLGSSNKKARNCFVFSPCPSSKECPRFNFDIDPCNFEVKYRPLYPFHIDGCSNDRFCYVVIRRGKHNNTGESWPRLIEEPKIRSGHVICRTCTKDAKISELVLTKSKHKQSFRLIAKRSAWGDVLPIHIQDNGNVAVESDDSSDDSV